MFVSILSGLWILLGCLEGICSSPVVLESKGYEGIVVGISEEVGSENCRVLLDNLETALTSASKHLHSALEGRASFSEISIVLPDHWSDSCAGSPVENSRGETFDFIVGRTHPVHGDDPWTRQSRGCGRQGDFVYLSEKLFYEPKKLGNELAKEWAKYRYGIFDEIGYRDDAVYPTCFHGVDDKPRVTGCSDKPIGNICASGDLAGEFNATRLVHPDATRSVLFAATEKVTKFCDEKTHDAFAPTKQNLICSRKSASEVILSHPDFMDRHFQVVEERFLNVTPTFKYIRRKLTRYVLVVENTKDMMVRESWSFLRAAIRKWTVHDLPVNTEVGFVLANESSAVKILDLHLLNGATARDTVASQVPYTPGDSRGPGCISCGIAEAFEMLEERKRKNGPASSVILVVAPGTEKYSDMEDVVERARRTRVRIVTINYPGLIRSSPLDSLSLATGGSSFTVTEKKNNLKESFLTTYFDLSNAFYAITSMYFEGNPDSLPIEIHRRELTDDGRSSITGSFVLEESLGEPAEFIIYTHNIETPLLCNIQLVSPSQKVYTGRTDSLLQFKLMKVVTNINETGTWTYTIERDRNPQPHFVQVMASPKSPMAPVVRARLWTNTDPESGNFFMERNRREVGKPSEETEFRNEERTFRIPLTNSVDYHVGRSFEGAENLEMSTRSAESFAEYENDDGSSKPSESRNLPAYKLTVDDLRRSQGTPGKSRSVFVRNVEPVILYVEVKRGNWPVLGARVEVTVTKRTENDTNKYRERFELLDSGSGDPDLMKGDGIYSKYWSPVTGGKGTYTIDVVVSDNGNTAYSWNEGFFIPQSDRSCCGSVMRPPSVRPLSPFRRQLPPLTLTFTKEDVENIAMASVGRVADLKVEHIPSELKARLIWTAPDMGGFDVSRYSLRFSPSLETLLSDPLSTSVWSHGIPFPLSAGSETSFTLDFSQNRNWLDQPLYFAILSYGPNPDNSLPGPLGNHVRVYLPSPPPPPPPSPNDESFPRTYHTNRVDPDDVVPRIAQADFRLELIIPVVGGLLLLFVCLGIYCYFCILRRKHAGTTKTKQTQSSSPEKSKQTAINIISSPTSLNPEEGTRSTSSTTSSSTSHSTLQQENCNDLRYDPATPPYRTTEALDKYGYLSDSNRYRENYEDRENERRYSMLRTPEEAYAVAERNRCLARQRPPSNASMAVYDRRPPGYVSSQISNGTTGRIRTLSPFQSWTASQLLHEHERRNSPYGDKPERPDEVNRHDGPQFQLPPPVPPLPAGVYGDDVSYGRGIYGDGPGPDYAGYLRTTINPSLQGSLTSVNSGDVRKKRNVTMV